MDWTDVITALVSTLVKLDDTDSANLSRLAKLISRLRTIEDVIDANRTPILTAMAAIRSRLDRSYRGETFELGRVWDAERLHDLLGRVLERFTQDATISNEHHHLISAMIVARYHASIGMVDAYAQIKSIRKTMLASRDSVIAEYEDLIDFTSRRDKVRLRSDLGGSIEYNSMELLQMLERDYAELLLM